MKKIMFIMMLALSSCSRTNHYINNSSDLRTCNASWNSMIGQIQAKSYLRDCERTNLATGYIPINIGAGHTGIFPDPEYTQDNGFGVLFVIEGSPADKAGITVGDFITKVNGKPVKNYKFLLGCIGGDNYKTVKLEILRQGKVIEYEINKKMINKYNYR